MSKVFNAHIVPQWSHVISPCEPVVGDPEMAWLEQAQAGHATAALWSGTVALVAPLSYRNHAALDAAAAAFAARGCPVRLRRSGGGVVPQGPGILNLSLAYPCSGDPGSALVQVYAHLCGVLGTALTRLGIDTASSVVEGSFCDGRYNLAVAQDGSMRKIAGTAQYWRRGAGRHAVLAHALLLVDADLQQLCEQANRFEAALGSARHYRSQALTNVAQAWRAAHRGQPLPPDLSGTVKQHIVAALID